MSFLLFDKRQGLSYHFIMLATQNLKIFALTLGFLLMAAQAEALCVKASKANLRAGPSTKNQITWEVYKYMPLIEKKRQGSWVYVKDFEGDRHWIYKGLVTKDFQCAVVKVDRANLRTGPGTSHKKADDLPYAEKYMTFKFLRTKGNWAQVMDTYGDKYWVFRKLIWVY